MLFAFFHEVAIRSCIQVFWIMIYHMQTGIIDVVAKLCLPLACTCIVYVSIN
jgi:hypothetical protein